MENSPIDPTNYEKDEDSEEDDDDLTPPKSIIESIFKAKKEETKPLEKPSLLEALKDIDKNPELDSEAPVEELSVVEIQEISRDIARERLEEVDEEDHLDHETIASKTYLENVYETGDPDFAFIQAARELTVDQPSDPIELLEEADDSEITIDTFETNIQEDPGINHKEEIIYINPKNENINQSSVDTSIKKETPPPRRVVNVPKVVSGAALLDALLYRRKARIDQQNKSEKALKTKLNKEVQRLSQRITKQENFLRERAAKIENIPDRTSHIEKISSPPKNVKKERISKQEIIEIGKTLEKASIKDEKIVEKPKSGINLKRRELLLIASKVEVMGTNLRKIHESGQLTEKGLRRMIEVYLRGGNVKKALKRELLEREIDFERDPAIRDQGALDDENPPAKENKIEQLLKNRGLDLGEEASNLLSQPQKESHNFELLKPDSTKKAVNIIDLLLILLILILVVVVLLIFFKV